LIVVVCCAVLYDDVLCMFCVCVMYVYVCCYVVFCVCSYDWYAYGL
jgi:hypothetical protein